MRTRKTKKQKQQEFEDNFIIVKLAEPYSVTAEHIMNDEIKTAQKKWRVKLTQEQKNNVCEHAIRSFEGKMSAATNAYGYQIDDTDISIRIIDEGVEQYQKQYRKYSRGGAPTPPQCTPLSPHYIIELSNKNNVVPQHLQHLNILPTMHSHYMTVAEPNNRTVKLQHFHDFFLEQMEKWLRTAVFYGVASYA